MAFDDDLANRIREIVGQEPGMAEQRMFGGLAFLVDGNMAVSASSRGGLLVRVDPAEADRLVARAHVVRFEMRGRRLDGWVHIGHEGLRTKRQLAGWVARCHLRAVAPLEAVDGLPRPVPVRRAITAAGTSVRYRPCSSSKS